jgi:hypothetical protein
MLHPFIVSQCGQNVGIRRGIWIIEKLHESETFCSVGFEYEDCSILAAACLIHFPDPSFQLPMWPARLPP